MKRKISLKELHTFGLEVCATDYCAIHSEKQLREALPLTSPFFILGGGSNILFTKSFEGLVVHNQIKGIELVEENATNVWIRVGGGEVWHELVLWSIEQGYAGLENLSLIPGSVGAAPIQNIGAYGVELKDVFHHLEAIDLATGQTQFFSLEDCEFGYRDSIFKRAMKGKCLITRVILRLSKEPVFNTSYGAIQQILAATNAPVSIRAISDAIIQIRTQKLPDPKKIGNSGSFFKNPIIDKALCEKLQKKYPKMPVYPMGKEAKKLAAGWLIDQLGWKGYREGDAGVHTQQALVLVNYGKATGQEIWNLAQKIQASVWANFGVKLEAEVNIL
ncbi:UDP-N-acetylmuramate dehydrogenase [Aureispira anguillae]|uniref:UDP-N-acetylenolpyruvoylglucosamine reductase n=1 Tax=Aureispira anguillae TaxID=2864201 RepID=A0A915YIN6_9BACT|nr:UDP-N-acetylmuramate dehydrogenase [Aureispira anguillae]BDS13714.1 UDP-N-acetylmuramate dehydrogenase [Aureispira anguillae]